MSKSIKATTARGVAALVKANKPGQYAAGKGLYLVISASGGISWMFRYKVSGKTTRMGLGREADVSLREAGELADQCRALLRQGVDPLEARNSAKLLEASKTVTFDEVAADYIASQRPGWKNAKHAQQWENTLATYVSPVIGNLAPAEITTEHVLKILTPIWNTKKETASRVRNRIELVLNAAKARKLRTGENVAAWRGHLELLLSNHKRNSRRHHPALPWGHLPEFWQVLSRENDISAKAVQLTILTGLRTREVLEAHRSEFDLQAGIWTVPAERMKAGKEHRVPLSRAAIEVLEGLPVFSSGLLFEGRSAGVPVSNMAMLMKLRRMDERKHAADGTGWRDELGQVITVHGFRSTFRDWAAENTGYENIVVEQALAHTIGNAVEAAYRRGDLLERRRELMESWAGYATSKPTAKVIQLRRGGIA